MSARRLLPVTAVMSAALMFLLVACGQGNVLRLAEVRFRNPSAATVGRYQVRPQHLVVEVYLQHRVTDRVVLWLTTMAGERRTVDTVVGSIPVHDPFSVDVPLEGLDGSSLPPGCYRIHLAAYEDEQNQHGGDSCVIEYAGPGAISRPVDCSEQPGPQARCRSASQ